MRVLTSIVQSVRRRWKRSEVLLKEAKDHCLVVFAGFRVADAMSLVRIDLDAT